MPVQQHPIPQDVSNYKFRLVGDMTLKQFLQLAVGIILGLVVWSSPLPFFFKYPLTVIFACLGVGMAFVPVEGRPLDQWLIAFIKSIYSPTIFVWEKSNHTASTSSSSSTSPITPTVTSVIRPPTPVFTTPISKSHPMPTYSPTPPAPISPTPPIESVPQISTPSPQLTSPITPPSPIQNSTFNIHNSSPTIPAYQPSPQPTPTPPVSAPQPTASTSTPSPFINHNSSLPAGTASFISQSSSSPAPITTSTGLPIPFTPTTPNTLVGMVLTPDSHIIENAIIEIIHNGLTIRATKSNKLGQFLFARPLDNGTYTIITQKEARTFETYGLTLSGKVVPPLKLQAKT